MNGVQILILPLTSGVTLGRLLTLSALNAGAEVMVPDSLVFTVPAGETDAQRKLANTVWGG